MFDAIRFYIEEWQKQIFLYYMPYNKHTVIHNVKHTSMRFTVCHSLNVK